MGYALIDDKFFSNPKVRRAGVKVAYMYLAGLAHANSYLTDGIILTDDLPILAAQSEIKGAKKAAQTLVECGLWDKIDGGWFIHDYFDFNKSKAEIEAAQEQKRAAGSKGGRAKAEAAAIASAKANAIANAKAGAMKPPKQKGKQNDSETLAISPIPIPLKDTTTTPPFNPPTNSDDSEKPVDPRFDALFMTYQSETGKSPQFDAAEVELIAAMLTDDVTPDELRIALREMTAKGFACPRISSARNWIVNNREKKKRKGRQPVKEKPGLAGGYVPSTLSEIVVEG